MNFETTKRVYEQIEATELKLPKRELIRLAVQYARIRADWCLADRETRREMDRQRKAIHDALIDACNILGRDMATRSEDNSWRQILGSDRRDIGDFACFLHCLLGLRAR